MSLGESYWHLSLFLFSCLICLRLPHILYRWRSKYGETLARVAFCTQTPAELCGPRLQANVVSMSQMSQESPGITRNPASSKMDMFRTCFCGNSVLPCFTMLYLRPSWVCVDRPTQKLLSKRWKHHGFTNGNYATLL